MAVVAGLSLQPRGFLLPGHELAQVVPFGMQRRGNGGALGHTLDRTDEGHEIDLAHDLQLALHRLADGRLIQRRQRGAAVGLAQRARVQDIARQHVVHEGRPAHLRRQVDARHALSDHLVGCDLLGRHRAGDGLREVDLGRDGPVILACRCAVLQEPAIDHRKLVAAAVEAQRRSIERLGANLGADQPYRAARHVDRQRRGRIELVRAVRGVAGQHGDATQRHVQFFSRDLADGGNDALPHLDLAGGDAHGAIGLELDPAVETRVLDQARGQHGRIHAMPPLRSIAAARSTARRMRWCAPQRQRCLSSAATISARLGSGLRSSSALAEMRIPERQ